MAARTWAQLGRFTTSEENQSRFWGQIWGRKVDLDFRIPIHTVYSA